MVLLIKISLQLSGYMDGDGLDYDEDYASELPTPGRDVDHEFRTAFFQHQDHGTVCNLIST